MCLGVFLHYKVPNYISQGFESALSIFYPNPNTHPLLAHPAEMDDLIETPLSPIDHAAPRHYCAFRFYLPLKPGVTPESAFKVLHDGLQRTFTQLPWLSGQTWYQDPDAKGYRPGQLVIRHGHVHAAGPWPGQLVFHQSDSGETFDELREEGLPTDALPDSLPEWISFPPDVGKGPDVFKPQATFIPGGCILLAGPQHLVCDGTAAISIINLWAQHCRAIQLQSDVSATAILPAISDRTLLAGACQARGSKDPPDSAAWRLFGRSGPPPPVSETEASHAPPTPLTEVPMKSAIFYIPADRLTLLYKNSVDGNAAKTADLRFA
ncbi:Trichothecene 3-O-acetyltransferase [Fusarium albosuccineum]|uniref:Trichothecene 3-O-acetyltransferase n=1 Tax=Fusarium albosuccineum TaxID=1237068 RepID=A0A8H4L6D7_9HYPO|nr:Trichothecene 3-O-acetyltransferase [Fusarium albosuccineum]